MFSRRTTTFSITTTDKLGSGEMVDGIFSRVMMAGWVLRSESQLTQVWSGWLGVVVLRARWKRSGKYDIIAARR